MEPNFAEAREEYSNGNRLTNEELDCLYWYYQNVYTTVSAQNEPCYKLVWKDAFYKADELKRMIESRKQRLTTASI
jgi:hypothetical protein